eukprot:m.414349 g.414349  ORF g.414349 m.414349 type:complete len:146 (-) comp56592_c0_seq5:1192-1629(-)
MELDQPPPTRLVTSAPGGQPNTQQSSTRKAKRGAGRGLLTSLCFSRSVCAASRFSLSFCALRVLASRRRFALIAAFSSSVSSGTLKKFVSPGASMSVIRFCLGFFSALLDPPAESAGSSTPVCIAEGSSTATLTGLGFLTFSLTA